jgi:hypothetical protein
MAFPVRNDAAAVVHGGGGARRLEKDVFHLRQLGHVLGQHAPRGRGGRKPVHHGLGIGQENHAVLGKVGAQRDIQKSALVFCEDLGDAADGLGDLALCRDVAKASRPLGHEIALLVGQNCNAPGMDERSGDLRCLGCDLALDGRGVRLLLEGGRHVGAVRVALLDRRA